jgi:hypothetical protein
MQMKFGFIDGEYRVPDVIPDEKRKNEEDFFLSRREVTEREQLAGRDSYEQIGRKVLILLVKGVPREQLPEESVVRGQWVPGRFLPNDTLLAT